ncbi:MAG: Wzy polymerase domain-containing protein [Hylemonella sp.]|nr:Wzy polymerase domain-containing protein [Hylemonella sp.]
MPVSANALFSLLAVALPFLFPWSAPPLPELWALLFSWACIALLAALAWCQPESLDGWARRLAWGLLLAALCSAVIGLLQYFGYGAHLSLWAHAAEAGQAQGNLRQRNHLASLLNLGSWAALWLLAQRPAGEVMTLRVRAGVCLALGLLAAGCAATASRTGGLQWLLMGGLLVWWWRASGRAVLRWGLLAGLVYGLSAGVLPLLLQWGSGVSTQGVFERVALESASCESRSVLWANVLTLIAQRPWTGWGWGELDYAHYMTLFPGLRFCVLLDNAHNLPLQLAVELGLPLALLACGGILVLLWSARPWREAVPARQLAWGVLALIGLHSLLEYPLWYGPFQLTVLYALALLRPASLGRWHGPAWAPAFVLGFFLALGSYLLWDYHRVRQLYLTTYQRDPAYREQTLDKVGGSWVYANEVNFAIVTTTPLTPQHADRIHALSLSLLHYSPEPAVIEALIGSACLLGRNDEAAFHYIRYRAAYPQDHARWQGTQTYCPRFSPELSGPVAESPVPHRGNPKTP